MDVRTPDIPQFYAGKAVFITGATGFMGKVLVERLLSTCPQIGRIYLLMREKQGVCPDQRLTDLKQSPVFDVLRQSRPEQLEKLVPVPGDVTSAELGLSQESLAQLKEVSLVFHSAATVRFNEKLGVAVDQNLNSVIRIMDLCEMLPNIKALIHVSTAYSNAELSYIEEKVYPTTMEVKELMDLIESGAELTEQDTLRIISPKPNTYAFTKAMAERAIEERTHRRYPVAIFRPTIVVSSLRHPFPGWIENANGPTAVIAGAATGLMRVSWSRGAARADLVPVDLAIDTLIAVGWDTAVDKPRLRVYNCSTQDNPCSWGRFKDALNTNLGQFPFSTALWYPQLVDVDNALIFKTWELLVHTIPHHLAEYATRLLGFKSRVSLIKVSERLRNLNQSLSYFSRREWRFDTAHVDRLRRRLCARDRAVFNLDPASIEWKEHLANYVKGTKKHILKETNQDLETSRKRMQRLHHLHNATKLLLLCVFIGVWIKMLPQIK